MQTSLIRPPFRDISVLNKFRSILLAVVLQMFNLFTKVTASLNLSLLETGSDMVTVESDEFSICLESCDRFGNFLWFFVLEVVSADLQNNLIGREKLQIRFRIIFHGFCGSTRE